MSGEILSAVEGESPTIEHLEISYCRARILLLLHHIIRILGTAAFLQNSFIH